MPQILSNVFCSQMTPAFLSHKNIDTLQTSFNKEIDLIFQWFICNKLSINEKKTNFMIFTKKKINKDSITVKLGNSDIQRVSSTKFLGVTIDENLSWVNHVDIICNKISKSIGVMYSLKSLPKNVLKMIYYSTVFPHLHYAITAW